MRADSGRSVRCAGRRARGGRAPAIAALFAALFLFVGTIAGGAAGPAAGITVGGRVLGPGGTPLPKTKVILLPAVDPVSAARMADEGRLHEPAAFAMTDASGAFGLEAPRAGAWRVRVDAPGFVPVELPLVDAADLPDVELAPDSGLTVRVAGSDGAPVAGARVRLAPPRPKFRFLDAGGWSLAARTALTREDGTARLPRSASEPSLLTVSAPGCAFVERRDLRGTSASVRLERAEGGASSGRANSKTARLQRVEVVSDAGKPVAGALVLAEDGEHPLGFTGGNGVFDLAVPAKGETPVTVLATDGRRLETRVRVTRERPAAEAIPSGSGPPAATSVRRLRLPARTSVSGRVVDALTRGPVGGAFVWSAEDPWAGVATDGSGRFTLSGPAGESVSVAAAAAGYLPGEGLDVPFREGSAYGRTIPLRPAASIEGVVVDAEGRPVAGAEVRLSEREEGGEREVRIRIGGSDSAPRAVTSPKGRFRLGAVDPAKSWDLRAKAAGYGPGKREITGLQAYRPLVGLRVELARARGASGRVVDSERRPIPGVEVTLRAARPARAGGAIMIEPGGPPLEKFVASSDADGRFLVSGLGAGRFDLELSRAGWARATVPGIDLSGPGKRAAAGRGPGSNAAGAKSGGADDAVDLGEFSMERGERIDGIVTGGDGAPIDGVEVSRPPGGGPLMMVGGPPGLPGGGDRPHLAVTGTDGRFAVDGLRAGEPVNLSFHREGYVDASANGLTVPRSDPLAIVLHPASKLSGRVVDSSGKGIPRAEVSLTRRKAGGLGGEGIVLMFRQGAHADSEGRFVFEDQDPGKVSLSAVAEGRREARLDGVEIPTGKDIEGIEIPLAAGCSVEGRVLTSDGRPAIGAYVGVAEESRDPIRMRGVATDGDGRYRLDGLAPGRVSIEATYEQAPRAVRDLDAKAGDNVLDLQLEGGQRVAGTLVDTAGRPIAGAWVRLEPAGRDWGGPEGATGAEGGFRLEGVTDGVFSLVAGKAGWGTSRATRVEVAGGPVEGLRVTLEPAGTISGSVSGLDPSDYAQVEIRASNATGDGFTKASLDRLGNFRLESLSPGTWSVTGSVGASGRQARSQAILEAGGEARVSLEFGAGLVLSGHAKVGESPLSGAAVFAQGLDVNRSGWARTDEKGAFRVEGLEKGSYRLELRQWETGISHDETVELAASRDIDVRIPTSRIAGRVVDSMDRRPLSGVTVALSPGSGAEAAAGRHFPMEGAATTDLSGRFEIGNVSDGSWRLAASRQGYAAATTDVAIVNGHDVADVDLALDPTDGLALEVRLPSGRPPDEVQVAVLDAAGTTLSSGTYASGEGGVVRLSSVPAGTWDLLVAAAGSAVVSLKAAAPGPPVPVGLPPACRLEVNVPELASSAVAARATITGPDGRLFRTLGWMSDPESRFRFAAGRAEVDTLPPGSWTIRVEATDGRVWTGRTTTAPGATASLTLSER